MSALPLVSNTFDPTRQCEVKGFDFADITYHYGISRGPEVDGRSEGADVLAVRVAFDRSNIRNAFRPGTVDELYCALDYTCQNSSVAAVILMGSGPSIYDGGHPFCSGGDQRVRDRDGYRYKVEGADPEAAIAQRRGQIDPTRAGYLHILEVQRLVRAVPKVVITTVPGWATGGGHSLNIVADLSVASIEHVAFMQTDTNAGSPDADYGLALLARQAGDERACGIFLLAERYGAEAVERWGIINRTIPHAKLEEAVLEWVTIITTKSPQTIRMFRFVFNLADDGLAGQQVFAGEATRMAYMMAEVQEGCGAFLRHRTPRWEDYPYYY